MLRNSKNQKGFGHLELILIIVVVFVVIGVGYFVYHKHSSTTPKSTTTSQSKGSSTASSGTLSAPTVPAKGAYIGAWINPNKGTGTGQGNGCTGSDTEAGCNEIAQLSQFKQSIGKSPAILHVYANFNSPLPITTLDAIKANGSIPLLDWHCSSVSAISSGQDDQIVTAYAQALKAYAGPVFLRWFWEMNLNDSGNSNCGAYNNGPAYIAAWQHIWNIFHSVGANNVAFVWCPSIQTQKGSFEQYYPGDKYVDWIGIDGYDRKAQGINGFSDIFSAFYSEMSTHNKPMMVAETASFQNPNTNSTEQAQYIQGIQDDAPKFPDFKAIVYFDSIGPAGNWSLQGDGITAFTSLSKSSYFSPEVN